MSETSLKLQKREVVGKKVKGLRKDGLVPGVIYGAGMDNINVQAEYNPLEKTINIVGRHSPIELDIDGKKQLAIVKNIDIDPVKRRMVNIEFMAIKAGTVIETTAPIKLVNMGGSEAEKAGLGLTQVLESVEVKAKPADLPEAIEVDVASLENLEDKISLEDIKLPSGVEFANPEVDLSQTIVNIYDPAAEAARAEAEEAAAAAESGTETEEAATEDASESEEKSEEGSSE